MISREKGQYVLRSKETNKVLGKHKSRAEAERQEAAIRLSKREDKS